MLGLPGINGPPVSPVARTVNAYEHFKEEINYFTSTNTYLHDSVHTNLKAFIVVDLMCNFNARGRSASKTKEGSS